MPSGASSVELMFSRFFNGPHNFPNDDQSHLMFWDDDGFPMERGSTNVYCRYYFFDSCQWTHFRAGGSRLFDYSCEGIDDNN